MASRQGSKSRKAGSSNFKGADSTASSTTSSSKLYQETSIDDGHSFPASSSAQSKQHFFSSDSFPQNAQPSKENVTVTVRFRPLSPREIHNGEEVAWYADGETIVRNEHNPTIAYSYEQRHVGSTKFNLLSSRSHTIFTLTIESSPLGDKIQGEAVHLSQLNLVDLAGSESSKVISKLTDVKASHVPYRDSKLIRILQSSLSGHDRVSLICTVTPASRISEETHNTLKFAHRAKHIEIQAKQNKITDEKSLIKKYQHEIRKLKEELEQLKQDTVPVPQLKDMGAHDTILLKQKKMVKSSYNRDSKKRKKLKQLSRVESNS
ncbi:PREDICTED: kinesin-related protein 11-like isoform X2 [Brassica oleracea var. oleracea]|uniref:kinesin-related protein 11-like isoform X2 n=1 Tax=Brassica oleracea var. oleracea TaxID=109376 RepID=UPI0006A72DA0|nr:PREDICTED: kinesin-related protein 11-like isoform X2 [Brassica oleracea var. oleracea]